MCDCNQEARPGKDTSHASGDQQQVSQIPSSSHLSATTDETNLTEVADIGERASARPDKQRLRDAW